MSGFARRRRLSVLRRMKSIRRRTQVRSRPTFSDSWNRVVEMARAGGRHHPIRMEEKNELPELFLISGQSLGVESLKGLFVGPLVVEPRLADVT